MGSVVYGCTKLVIGQLYPAYASFKAVKNRNVKEYVKWMIYWIVFSTYTVLEEMTDLFVYWLPLYYEIKMLILFWLVSPTTRGSSVLYRGLIHPVLLNKEEEIDQYLTDAIDKTYSVSVRYARLAAQKVTKAMIETAIRGGGGIVTTLKRSVSMNDLSQSDDEEEIYKSRRGGPRKQRALMTMSWHEAQTENSSSIFDAETEEEYSGYSPGHTYGQYSHVTRLRREGGRGVAQVQDLRTSAMHSSMDTRQYQNALVAKRHRRDDRDISSSSEKLYSTLPRVKATRSHTRRQDLGFKPYKAVSGRPSPTLHSAGERGRHSSRKLPAPKPPSSSPAAKPNLPKSPSKKSLNSEDTEGDTPPPEETILQTKLQIDTKNNEMKVEYRELERDDKTLIKDWTTVDKIEASAVNHLSNGDVINDDESSSDYESYEEEGGQEKYPSISRIK